jgi:hypothetical protein
MWESAFHHCHKTPEEANLKREKVCSGSRLAGLLLLGLWRGSTQWWESAAKCLESWGRRFLR